MCHVCLLSHFIVSNTFDMTYFMGADDLISLLLLFTSDIFHYLCSLFLCLMSAVFTTAVSILLKPGDKYFSTSMLNPWWYLEQGDVVKVFIGLWTSTTTLFFFKPVRRATDKEYLPPRSSGLLQLCTLTGATSRLSESSIFQMFHYHISPPSTIQLWASFAAGNQAKPKVGVFSHTWVCVGWIQTLGCFPMFISNGF